MTAEAPPLAERPLFDPLVPWLAQLSDPRPPSLARLQRWLDEADPPAVSGGGAPLRFVEPVSDGVGYEQRIYRTGQVSTRAGHWHDAFNALVWLRFPLAKAALNALHLRETGTDGVRGGPRDAATLFDESGVIVACRDESLADALRAHRWRELFVQRRGELVRLVRFVIFGHALYDQMRAPFYGLCGKALSVELPDRADREALYASIDAQLAARFATPGGLADPAALHPLPMLGVPGVTPASEDPVYYDDIGQFRPLRRGKV